MAALDRVFRGRRPAQERPAAAVVAGLWRNGEQGAWYDPSDLSTMFQDPAGTTPVYMPGQGQPDPWIGLLLDKRLGLVRGPERLTNGDFSAGSAAWAVANNDATHTATFASGALQFKVDSLTPALTLSQLSMMTPGKWYEVTLVVTAWASGTIKTDAFAQASAVLASGPGTFTTRLLAASSVFSFTRGTPKVDLTIDSISIRELPGNHRWQGTATSRPVLSARYNLLTGTESLATQSVTVAATTYTLATGGSGSVTLSGAASGTYASGSRSITCTAGTLTLTVSGSVTQADLRSSTDGVGLPPYQRVVDASTYDTVGFPLYRKPDGVDDWMQTGAVDFSGTDKVTIAAAFRKLTDVGVGMFAELGPDVTTTAGTFGLYNRNSGIAEGIMWRSRGTNIASAAPPGLQAPVSLVAVGTSDLSTGLIEIRVNGALAASSSTPQGGGAYGTYPIYFDRRAGASLPSSARDYGTLIVGRLLTGPETAAVEKYLRQKSRAY